MQMLLGIPLNFQCLLRLSLTVFLLACQSAQTQQVEEIPRVSDKVDVPLEPQVVEPTEPKKKVSEEDPLKTTMKKYSSGEGIKIELIKTTKLKMLNRVEEQKGQILLKGRNKLRMEFDQPMKTVSVLNGARAWVIEYPAEDSSEKIRVSRFNMKSSPGQNQLLITSILSSGNLLKTFKVKKQSAKEGHTKYELIPKKAVEEIKSIELVIDSAKEEILELSYLDPIENETKFKFLKTAFGAKLENSVFDYKAPKDAEVNEF